MAFSSGVSRKGKSSRGRKSASGSSRKFLYLTAALGTGGVVAAWLMATAATMHTMAGSVSPAHDNRPRAVMLAKPAPFDPRVLVVSQPAEPPVAAKALDADALAAYWSRKSKPVEAAEVATLVLPPAVSASAVAASFGKPTRPTWGEIQAAMDAGRMEILRRAMASTGTDAGRTGRLDFVAPEEAAALTVVASLGAPLPAPEASIEIAFVADQLAKPGIDLAEADHEPGAAPEIGAAKPGQTEVASLGNPFEEVLATPEAGAGEDALGSVPLPATRPARPAAAPTIPMRAKTQPEPKEAPKSLLAYARPENPLDTDDSPSLFGKRSTLPGRASRIAVYDISAGVVHMPSGEKLKAHSGRGEMRDDPRFVHIKNRGPTPPNVYSLRMRESRFHGIEAIRMTPVGDAKMFGRDGFLTHTYLLRRRGDSSGCVVFEDYNRFLNAFKRGEVKTIVVVPRMAELQKYMAML